jgi:transcriptional regulator GlxA family with amidase domain
LPDIVAASGIPGRTLLKHFRDFRGTSPMRYLRRARFERVHQALHSASTDDGVTQIALAHGFTHMGRFSVEYQKQFGESPSATLRRRAR